VVRELFFGWDHGGRQCWGVRKSNRVPEHKNREQERTSHEGQGDNESMKTSTHLKSCESLYTCPRTPFYRETKGLFHSKITLESRNILCMNMYMNVFYIPWFAGLISYIYEPATSSHFKPVLFGETSLTWLPVNLGSFIHEIHHSSRFLNGDFPRFPNSAGCWFPDFR
jgi:hypothetical protein